VTHLLDTDTLSIWQNGTGAEYAVLVLRLSAHPPTDIGVPVVSFHEQMIGANAYLSRGRVGADLVTGYHRLEHLRHWYTALNVVAFDDAAGTRFDQLKAAKVRVGTMDLRIAAIALARGLIIVTRNARDFGQVPGLTIEDWTR
jgi:tRNA(fMet)-specific endonuclease VapC